MKHQLFHSLMKQQLLLMKQQLFHPLMKQFSLTDLALQKIKNRNQRGSDEIPIELFNSLGKGGKMKTLEVCGNIYREVKWPEDFFNSVPVPKRLLIKTI